MSSESKIERLESSGLKKYSAPSLINYGSVRALTQTGTGITTETQPGMSGMCNADSFAKPCSERRVKENIVRIGNHPFGFGLYLFDYRPEHCGEWGHGRQFGVMIDEVEIVMPEAVCKYPDGYKRVDYGMLGISRYIN